MLVIIFAFILLFFISYQFGQGYALLLNKLSFVSNANKSDEVIYHTLSGLMVIMVFSSILSIFFRLNWEVLLVVFLISLFVFFVNLNSENKFLSVIEVLKAKPLITLFSLLIPLLLLLYCSIENPGSVGDTILYHAQCIQWAEKYEVIPGIANLHNRLAFNNHSLLLYSLFTFSFLGKTSIYFINSFLFLLLLIKCSIDIINAYNAKELGELLFSLLVVSVSFYFFGIRMASPQPDGTAAILGVFFILLFKDIYCNGYNLIPQLYLVAACLITVKISTLFIILLPAILFFKRKLHKAKKNWFLAIGICLITFVPFFIRNIYMSGYLVYPVPIDLFNFDWKWQSLYRVNLLNDYITNAARITGGHRKGVWTIDMPFQEWFFEYWFTNTRKTIVPNIMLGVSLFAAVVFPIVNRFIGSKKKEFYYYFFIYLLVSIAFWFIKAPDYRFLWANLTVSLAVIGLFVGDYIKVNRRTLLLLPIFLMNLFLIQLAQKNVKKATLKNYLVFPKTVETIEVEEHKVQYLTVNIPAVKKFGGACYNAPIPCTHNINKKLVMRGDRLNQGFKLK